MSVCIDCIKARTHSAEALQAAQQADLRRAAFEAELAAQSASRAVSKKLGSAQAAVLSFIGR